MFAYRGHYIHVEICHLETVMYDEYILIQSDVLV